MGFLLVVITKKCKNSKATLEQNVLRLLFCLFEIIYRILLTNMNGYSYNNSV